MLSLLKRLFSAPPPKEPEESGTPTLYALVVFDVSRFDAAGLAHNLTYEEASEMRRTILTVEPDSGPVYIVPQIAAHPGGHSGCDCAECSFLMPIAAQFPQPA